ncbi:hypothetical protein KQ945_11825 [Bacillus subtilis subsp. subtilis]|nr:hypothetical protein [Bacillus subtilis subsp. subtilis]
MDNATHALPAFALIGTASAAELDWIAGLGHAEEQARHRAALQVVVNDQGGRLHDHQLWYPYEVIERGAGHYQPGHEREFVLCTLLVILAVHAGQRLGVDMALQLDDLAATYETLPPVLRDIVLDAYQALAG